MQIGENKRDDMERGSCSSCSGRCIEADRTYLFGQPRPLGFHSSILVLLSLFGKFEPFNGNTSRCKACLPHHLSPTPTLTAYHADHINNFFSKPRENIGPSFSLPRNTVHVRHAQITNLPVLSSQPLIFASDFPKRKLARQIGK